MYMYVCIFICMYVCMYVNALNEAEWTPLHYAAYRVCMYACIDVCMYVCMYLYMYDVGIYACM